VKNVGESAIEAILDARKEGPFTDIFDFCERVDLRRVNKRVVESLVKCGAFYSSGARRAALMAGLEDAMALGQRIQQERESDQVSLFGAVEMVRGNGNGAARLPDVPEWDEKLLLGFEKEALGFFITGHPLSRHLALMKRFVTADAASLSELPDKSDVRLCGLVGNLKEILTKKGERMAFVVIEDLTGSVEVVVLPDIYSTAVECLKGEEPVLVAGTLEVGEKGAKIRAAEVASLRDVQERDTKKVHFTVTTKDLRREQLVSLREILTRFQGSSRTMLHMVIPDESRTTIRLPESCNVTACDELALAVNELLSYNAVSFE
jgi:DNA polymerase-3 subunit alpha